VIKGVASALYGAGAMAGVVNLISRRPGAEPVHEVLINRSTLGATDASVFAASKLTAQWGGSMLASGDWLFLRITDPARKCDPLGKAPFEDSTYGGAAAYASPWFFTT